MSDNLTQSHFLSMLGRLLVYADLKEIKVICSSYIRTAEEQAEQYKIGRRGIDGEQPVTTCDGVAKISRHQTKTAIDLNVINEQGNHVYDMPPYLTLGKYWETLGGIWGGNWASSPEHWHFDLR
jgi:hypothetical protein